MIVGLILCVFPPQFILFRWGSRFAVQFMFSYLVAGLVFLLLKERRLTMTAFICCAALALYLRSSIGSEDTFRYAFAKPTDEKQLNVLYLNTSSTNETPEQTAKKILSTHPDLIAVTELTPDWEMELSAQLATAYPYKQTYRNIDFYGIGVYSRYPLVGVDTFETNHVPNIIGRVQLDKQHPEVWFIGTHTPPPLNIDAYEAIRRQLEQVSDNITRLNDVPLITFGDYNLVPWSFEMQRFRTRAHLSYSRRYFSPGEATPMDYIFYSRHFNCLSFENVRDSSETRIAILGRYQFKPEIRKK